MKLTAVDKWYVISIYVIYSLNIGSDFYGFLFYLEASKLDQKFTEIAIIEITFSYTFYNLLYLKSVKNHLMF